MWMLSWYRKLCRCSCSIMLSCSMDLTCQNSHQLDSLLPSLEKIPAEVFKTELWVPYREEKTIYIRSKIILIWKKKNPICHLLWDLNEEIQKYHFKLSGFSSSYLLQISNLNMVSCQNWVATLITSYKHEYLSKISIFFHTTYLQYFCY